MTFTIKPKIVSYQVILPSATFMNLIKEKTQIIKQYDNSENALTRSYSDHTLRLKVNDH